MIPQQLGMHAYAHGLDSTLHAVDKNISTNIPQGRLWDCGKTVRAR